MNKEYSNLEVLCKQNGVTRKLIYRNGKFDTFPFWDRVFLANEGPSAKCEMELVDLLTFEDIDSIKLPEDTESFTISLVNKTYMSCKTPIICVNNRTNLVNIEIYKNRDNVNELFHEFAYATKEKVIESKKEKQLILK